MILPEIPENYRWHINPNGHLLYLEKRNSFLGFKYWSRVDRIWVDGTGPYQDRVEKAAQELIEYRTYTSGKKRVIKEVNNGDTYHH